MITLTTEQAQQIEEAFDKAQIGLRGWELPENRYAALHAINPALATIRAARAQEQAEQEPVAWKDLTYGNLHHQDFGNSIPLYTNPVRTKDLTVSELDAIIEKHYDDEMDLKAMILDGIAADREKNNANNNS